MINCTLHIANCSLLKGYVFVKRFLGTFIGKSIFLAENLMHKNASSFPGKAVLALFPDYLKKIKYPPLIVMVTGSCGKGSTTRIIADVLRENGSTVAHNLEGSNLLNGVASTVIKNVSLSGKLKQNALVLEVDERYLKLITKYITPNYLVINNLTRDQPPRQGDFDIVFGEILKGIPESTHIIVNGDDPITKSFSLYRDNITYFGINEFFASYENELDDVRDMNYCPKCHSRLEYQFRHYGSVGGFNCTACGFSRNTPDFCITDVNKDTNEITLNGTKIIANELILFNLYNIAAAYSVLSLAGVSPENIASSINAQHMQNKIYKEITKKDRKYIALNCKAENNATYNLAVIHTSLDKSPKSIVLGLREISRRYTFFDLSWLYDINFEMLNDDTLQKVVCAGPYRYDFAARITLAGIPKDKIIILENLDHAGKVLDEQTLGNVYGILNFDYIEPFINSVNEIE